MNAFDLFVYANFAVLIGTLAVFAFLYWRDERGRR